MNYLQQELDRLRALETAIRGSGDIAPANCWVGIQTRKGRDKSYARKCSSKKMFKGEKFEGLGQVGSDRHKAFELEIKRRNALAEIERRIPIIQAMIDKPIWEP